MPSLRQMIEEDPKLEIQAAGVGTGLHAYGTSEGVRKAWEQRRSDARGLAPTAEIEHLYEKIKRQKDPAKAAKMYKRIAQIKRELGINAGGPGSGCRGPNCGRHKGSGGDEYSPERNAMGANTHQAHQAAENYHRQLGDRNQAAGLDQSAILHYKAADAHHDATREIAIHPDVSNLARQASMRAFEHDGYDPNDSRRGDKFSRQVYEERKQANKEDRRRDRLIRGGGPGSGCHGENCGPKAKGGVQKLSKEDSNFLGEWLKKHPPKLDLAQVQRGREALMYTSKSVKAGGPGSGCRGPNCGRRRGGKGVDETHVPKSATVKQKGVTRGNVSIVDGSIKVNGQEVGRADQDLKFGYHPSVKVTLGGKSTWLELDTPNLVDKIFDLVNKSNVVKPSAGKARKK